MNKIKRKKKIQNTNNMLLNMFFNLLFMGKEK